MTFVEFINQKLETIKFSNKTKILIFIILSGTMTIGFLMFVSIFALKYDYETLFQKHTQPQVDLEEIKDNYRVNIAETLRDIREKQISNNDAIEVIILPSRSYTNNGTATNLQPIAKLEDFLILQANGWASF